MQGDLRLLQGGEDGESERDVSVPEDGRTGKEGSKWRRREEEEEEEEEGQGKRAAEGEEGGGGGEREDPTGAGMVNDIFPQIERTPF